MTSIGTDIDHRTYLSPFSWRYGSERMRAVWSELHKRRLWRRVWVALAAAQHRAGLVTAEQLEDLRRYQDEVDLSRALTIEAEIHHDLMAELRTFAEQCPIGGGVIHLGATSMDIEDNADVLRVREALDLILEALRDVLEVLAGQIETYADVVCMGFTHLQPAEPTTLGYRLATYGQDFLEDLQELRRLRDQLLGKGVKGAVGTSGSFAQLLEPTGVAPVVLERWVMDELGLDPFPVATQVYPRKQDWRVLTALAGLAMSVYRFAFDLRLLQSPPFGEWSEPFGARQVGSSAMPFKRNPINAENMNSLARYVAALPRVSWDNAAHNLLERTLDDSGNRRIVLPEAFLASDELLRRMLRVLGGVQFRDQAMDRNLAIYGVFAATEPLLMELVRAGASRQEMHECIREHAMVAWRQIWLGEPNPLAERLAEDPELGRYLSPERIRQLLDARDHVGDAPERARGMAAMVRAQLSQGEG
jgi:adenylosuccinate lyase